LSASPHSIGERLETLRSRIEAARGLPRATPALTEGSR
jgi:hypothetical protein